MPALAASYGVPVTVVESDADLAAALVPRPAGVEVVIARLGRGDRRTLTEAINAAARAAATA